MSALWPALAAVGGFVVGVMWREAFELIRGRDNPMDLWHRIRGARIDLLTACLTIALLIVAAVGAVLVVTDNQREDLVDCLTSYNQRQGRARDERAAATEKAARAQLAYVREDLTYQLGLEQTLSDGADTRQLLDTIRTRIEANRAYLRDLEQLQRVRVSTDYPPPNLCQDQR